MRTPVIVQGMEHKLQQVFLNLFLNAKDAMPKGGLAVGNDPDGRRQGDRGSGGHGLRHSKRVPGPASTIPSSPRRQWARAQGLGLSIIYGIVREHEGSIDCESVVGQGTRFIDRFPAACRPNGSMRTAQQS